MQFLDCEKYWFTIFHPKRMKAVGWCAVVSSPESCPEKMWRQKCFHRYEEASQDRKTRPRECAPASEHNPSANACWHFLSGGGGSVLPQKQLGCHSGAWHHGEFLWRHSGAWRHGSGPWRHSPLWRHGRACGGTARCGDCIAETGGGDRPHRHHIVRTWTTDSPPLNPESRQSPEVAWRC